VLESRDIVRTLAGLAIPLGAAVATDARAEPMTNTIAVEIAKCPVDATEVRRIAALELRAPIASSACIRPPKRIPQGVLVRRESVAYAAHERSR
jgi:hypothetical protein